MKEDNSYVAQAYNPVLGHDAVDGSLTFDRLRLRFVCAITTLEIPLIRLRIEPDETMSGRLCFSSLDQPDWVVCTSDERVLRNAELRHQPHTRNQLREMEAPHELKRTLKITFGVLGAFAVIALLGSVLTGIMVRALVAKIPPQWEQQVGDDLMSELKTTETFVQDPKLLAKLDQGVAPLISALPKSQLQYKFYLLEERIPNAFALPGGHVVVTTRLLEMSEKPEEIAGVVAHELAHVTQKHGFRKIIAGTGPYLIFKVFLGNSSGALPILGESSELLVRQSFSQEYELEADDVGWQHLVAAHIDPRGLAEMLKKFQAEQQRIPDAKPQLNAFSSHPATAKRIRRLEAKWEKLKNKSEFVKAPTTP